MAEPKKQYVRVADAAEILGVSVATLWRWTRIDPRFPRKRQLSPRVTVWNAEELRAWAEARTAPSAEPEPAAKRTRKAAPSAEIYA